MTFSHMSQQLLGNELRHHPQTGGGEKDELTDTDAQGYTIFFSSRFLFKKKKLQDLAPATLCPTLRNTQYPVHQDVVMQKKWT